MIGNFLFFHVDLKAIKAFGPVKKVSVLYLLRILGKVVLKLMPWCQYNVQIYIYTGCTIGSVTFLRNDTKYYEGAVAKNSSSHWVNRCRIYAYQISSPHQFLISHKLLFCYGANLGT